jgi:hypothetical protein
MFDSSEWLQNVDSLTKSIVGVCASNIQEALDRLAAYNSSLRHGGSGNCLKDTFNKIKWLGEKGTIEELRDKLKTATERITMLLTVASK